MPQFIVPPWKRRQEDVAERNFLAISAAHILLFIMKCTMASVHPTAKVMSRLRRKWAIPSSLGLKVYGQSAYYQSSQSVFI